MEKQLTLQDYQVIKYFKQKLIGSSLEDWKKELAEFVVDAHIKNKLIICKYQNLTFEPLRLMEELMKGHFVWGVVNWKQVDRSEVKVVDWPVK